MESGLAEKVEIRLVDLHRLIQLCRRNGIQEFEGNGVRLKFTLPAVEARKPKTAQPEKTTSPIEDLSPEERQEFFWWHQNEKEEDEVDFGKAE